MVKFGESSAVDKISKESMAPLARPVSTKEVLSSTGDRLAGWIKVIKKELDRGAKEVMKTLTEQQRLEYKQQGVEQLPCQMVFVEKPVTELQRTKLKLKENYKLKARLVVCGNWQIWQATSVENATQNIDAGALRLLSSLHSSATSSLTQLDVSAACLTAFLDSDNLADRIMVTPPSCLFTLGVIPKNTA
eukprot:1215461-Amphidinium_carterae.4